MRKILGIILVLMLAIGCIAVLYFSSLGGSARNNDKVLSFIPGDAALVAGFRNDRSIYGIFKDYPFFAAILGETRSTEFSSLQTLLQNPIILESTDGQHTFISFHPDQADSIQALLLITFLKKQDLEHIKEGIKKTPGSNLQTIRLAESEVLKLNLKGSKKLFYLYLEPNLATGSFSKSLLEQSLSKKAGKLDKKFISEISEGSLHDENSPVNIFINHSQLNYSLSRLLNPGEPTFLNFLTGLKGSSALNLNFKTDALMFSGISKTDTSISSYLTIFLRQKPVAGTMLTVLPASTASYMTFGLSDYPGFLTKLRQLFKLRNEEKKLKTQFDLILTRTGIDAEDLIKPQMGNEFALVQLADREKLGIVKVMNGLQLKLNLDQISTTVSDSISQFNNSNIPYYFFGDPFKSFFRPYFTVIDNYLVFTNSRRILERFMADYTSGNFLSNSAGFNSFNQFLANRSSVSLFILKENSGYMLRSVLRPKYASLLEDPQYGFKNFFGLSVQLNADGDHFFTNIYSSFAPATVPE